MKTFNLFITLMLFSLSVFLYAERPKPKTVSLNTALKLALKNNPDIKNSALAIVKFHQELDSFNTNYYPQIEVLSYLAPIYSVTGEGQNIKKDYSKWGLLTHNELSIVQPIYTFGALSDGSKAMENALIVKQAKRSEKVNNILFEVKKAYFQTLLVKELSKLSITVEEKLDEVLTKARALYKNENSNIKEYELIQLELFQIDFLKLKAKLLMNNKLAKKNLAFLCGLNPNTKLSISDKSFPAGSIKLSGLQSFLDLALKKQPLYKQISAGLKALNYKHQAKKALLYPQIFIAGRIAHSYTPMREKNDSPYVYNRSNYLEGGIAVGARWKLNFFKNKINAQKTKTEIRELKNKSKKARFGIPLLIEKAYLETDTAAKQLELCTSALRKSAAWVASVQSDFEMGDAKSKDLLEGFAAYIKAQQKLIQAKYNYQISLAKLVREVGSNTLVPKNTLNK